MILSLPNEATDYDLTKFHPLLATMHKISEECYCAGWMDGLEYVLWAAVMNPPLNGQAIKYGQGQLHHQRLNRLKVLARDSDCWFVWLDPVGGAEYQGGIMPVTLDWWIKHFNETHPNGLPLTLTEKKRYYKSKNRVDRIALKKEA